jgi:hypothetical protein
MGPLSLGRLAPVHGEPSNLHGPYSAGPWSVIAGPVDSLYEPWTRTFTYCRVLLRHNVGFDVRLTLRCAFDRLAVSLLQDIGEVTGRRPPSSPKPHLSTLTSRLASSTLVHSRAEVCPLAIDRFRQVFLAL